MIALAILGGAVGGAAFTVLVLGLCAAAATDEADRVEDPDDVVRELRRRS